MRRIPGTVLALSIVVVATILGWSPPAQAAPGATIEILFSTIVAKGAAVDIAYAVDCPAGFTGSTTIAVAQTHDGLTSTGSAVDELTCSETGLLFLQRVTADITGAPFARGKATLAMQAIACDDQGCFSTPLNQSIKITK